ncbi:hypothetical protein TNCT_501841 [Trichonephila clavata]|uniref:Uncharacterized protein n=1 Tax=Trichonephila clavata TaxID=2740835 RepID=A0A8X6G561_TRICU|nr:hypothetical protein TNCT_501841 [Trichonephila clavata]
MTCQNIWNKLLESRKSISHLANIQTIIYHNVRQQTTAHTFQSDLLTLRDCFFQRRIFISNDSSLLTGNPCCSFTFLFSTVNEEDVNNNKRNPLAGKWHEDIRLKR